MSADESSRPPSSIAPRFVLVGEVRIAEFALRGMVRAGHPPLAIVTTDTARTQLSSGMATDYYADLAGLAQAHGIAVHVVADLNSEHAVLASMTPDYVFALGWPYLIGETVLSIAPCIGLHPTRLPYRRGGAPLNWMILDGEPCAAVSLIRLRKGIDDGEILAQHDYSIGPDDYVGDVVERVCAIAEDLVATAVQQIAMGTARWTPQDSTRATYTRRRRPEDGRIRWEDSMIRIRNLVRATSHPFPGAFTHLGGEPLRVWRAEIPRGYRAPLRAAPGTIVDVTPDGVIVSTMDNALLLTEAQHAGRVPLSGAALRDALAPYVGRRFE